MARRLDDGGATKTALGVFWGLVGFSVLALIVYVAWSEYERRAAVHPDRFYANELRKQRESWGR